MCVCLSVYMFIHAVCRLVIHSMLNEPMSNFEIAIPSLVLHQHFFYCPMEFMLLLCFGLSLLLGTRFARSELVFVPLNLSLISRSSLNVTVSALPSHRTFPNIRILNSEFLTTGNWTDGWHILIHIAHILINFSIMHMERSFTERWARQSSNEKFNIYAKYCRLGTLIDHAMCYVMLCFAERNGMLFNT